MKQKIVIKVQMPCEKCRSKAMKIAATADGVTKVEIQGEEKDQLVVTGDQVDSVKLTMSLRKGLQHASLLSVQEEKDEKEKAEPTPIKWSSLSCNQYPTPYRVVVCDPNPSVCSIM